MRTRTVAAAMVLALVAAACTNGEEDATPTDEDPPAGTVELDGGVAVIGTFGLGAPVELQPADLHGFTATMRTEPSRVALLRPAAVLRHIDIDSDTSDLASATVTLEVADAGDTLVIGPDAFAVDVGDAVDRAAEDADSDGAAEDAVEDAEPAAIDPGDAGIEVARLDADGDEVGPDEAAAAIELTGEAPVGDYLEVLASVQFFNERFVDPDAGFDDRLEVAGEREVTVRITDTDGVSFAGTTDLGVRAPIDDPDDFDQSDATEAVSIAGSDGDDVLLGGAGDDFLAGGPGNNLVISGDGDDVMVGGVGSTLMVTGAGANRMVPTSLGGAPDIIVGFDVAREDRIDLTLLAEARQIGLPEVAVVADNVGDFLRIEEVPFDDPDLREVLAAHEGDEHLDPDSTYEWLEVDLDGPGGQFDFRPVAVLVDADLDGRTLPTGVGGWIAV